MFMGCGRMEKNYRVTTFVMDSGERYCMVVDRASGLPMYYPTLFLTTQIRNKGNAFSTTLAAANNLVGLAPIFPYTFYHLTHYWFAAADIPVANDTPVHYADAIRCNVRRPPQGSLPLLTRRVSA